MSDLSDRVRQALTFDANNFDVEIKNDIDPVLTPLVRAAILKGMDTERNRTSRLDAAVPYLIEAVNNICLDYDYGGALGADREGLPFIRGLTALREALTRIELALGGK